MFFRYLRYWSIPLKPLENLKDSSLLWALVQKQQGGLDLVVCWFFFLWFGFLQGDQILLWVRKTKIKGVIVSSFSATLEIYGTMAMNCRDIYRENSTNKRFSDFLRSLYRVKIFWTPRGIQNTLENSCYAFEIHFPWPFYFRCGCLLELNMEYFILIPHLLSLKYYRALHNAVN